MRARKPPSNRPPTRVLVAAGLSAVLVVAAIVVMAAGPGSGANDTAEGPSTTTPTATTPATQTTTEPTITVPTTTDPGGGTTTAPTTTAPTPTTPRKRPRVSRPPLKILPVRPVLGTVSWPDRARVAAVGIAVGNELARLDGRPKQRRAGLARLKARVAPNLLTRLGQLFGTDPPPAGAPAVTGRITALSLHEDPQTGARYATAPYYRIEDGHRQDGIMILEFAPAQPIVTDYRATVT